MRRPALVVAGALASVLAFAAACVDGTTPDCSLPEAGCDPDPSGTVREASVDAPVADGPTADGASDGAADGARDGGTDADADADARTDGDAGRDARPTDARADG